MTLLYNPTPYNFFNLVVASFTGLILLILAYRVLKRGISYKINQLFSLTLLSSFIIMIFFPVGGFYIDLAILTTKIYIQAAHFTVIFMFWSVALIYLGEENWRNPILVSTLLMISLFCVTMTWFSDSVSILTTQPELDMKIDNPLLLTTALLGTSLGTLSLILLIKSYQQTDKDDYLVLKQIKMFLFGYCVILLAIPLQFISESNLMHIFDKIGQILVICGFLIISIGFFSDVSLASIKIRSNLFRARVLLLKKGKIAKARNILKYCKELAIREGLDKILLDITFLEIRLLCIDLYHEKALDLGKNIEHLARKHDKLDEWNSILHEIKVQQASHDLSLSVEDDYLNYSTCDLQDSIKYLDKIIHDIQSSLYSE
ncbi:MAG: hypothetical protein ACTSPG_02320 [Candidatus Hodarchaeales archaeon]